MSSREERVGNPFFGVASPPKPASLIDQAFRAAFSPKSLGKIPDPVVRARARERARIVAFRDVVWNTLRSSVRSFPPLDSIHPFYRELADVVFGVDRLRHCLGALEWAAKVAGCCGRGAQSLPGRGFRTARVCEEEGHGEDGLDRQKGVRGDRVRQGGRS